MNRASKITERKDGESPRKPPLRLGILVEDRLVPSWIMQIVEDVRTSEYAHLALVLVKQVDVRPTAIPTKSSLLYSLYRKLDHFVFRPSVDAFETVSLDDEILADCSVIETSINSDGIHGQFCESDLSKIKKFNLDILLHLADSSIELNGSKPLARYGVIAPRPWPSNKYAESARKVLETDRVTRSVLLLSNSTSTTPRILTQSLFSTDISSPRRQENLLAWKAVSLVKNSVRQIGHFRDALGPYDRSGDEANSTIDREFLGPASRSFESTPGNRSMLKLGLAYGWRRLHRMLFRNRGQWSLCFEIGSKTSRLPKPDDLADYTPITAPKNGFYSDPFCVERDGRYFIFIEEWSAQECKGVISLIEMDPDGRHEKPVTVLQKDYHLSYPCVFSYEGRDYMIPETKKNRTIELYKCTSWPRDWKLEKVLFHDLGVVDPTIEKIDDKYWLFVGVEPKKGAINCDELDLYYADSPLGPWKPHPKNPVVSDVHRARPAGRLFREGGRIFRPAQDCSQRYGYAISINEIKKISPSDYEEKLVTQILPWGKDILGVHTLNRSGKLTILDFNRFRQE